jgi:hypothetical protein
VIIVEVVLVIGLDDEDATSRHLRMRQKKERKMKCKNRIEKHSGPECFKKIKIIK